MNEYCELVLSLNLMKDTQKRVCRDDKQMEWEAFIFKKDFSQEHSGL